MLSLAELYIIPPLMVLGIVFWSADLQHSRISHGTMQMVSDVSSVRRTSLSPGGIVFYSSQHSRMSHGTMQMVP